jgi:hypothetical protein
MSLYIHPIPEKNYLEVYVIEDAAVEEFLKLIGRQRFNSLANQVKKVSDKIDNSEDFPEDQALDIYFPIEDAQCALEYFKALSKLSFAKLLYGMFVIIE